MLSIESKDIPGFYEIPGYSKYVVSKDGRVYNRVLKHFLDGSVNSDGYINFRLSSDLNKILTWGLHRLLAYVFIHPGQDTSVLVVNHINADKSDNRIENLEWCTYQENQEHAGRLGLTVKCQPISVRDVDTGVVVHFPSIVACARVYGVSKDFINWRVKKGEDYVFPERKQYRGFQSEAPWKDPLNNPRLPCEHSRSKKILVRYLTSGAVAEYDTMSALAKHLEVSLSTLSTWIKLENQPVLPGYVQLKLAEDKNPWREVDDVYSDTPTNRVYRPIKVVKDSTSETVIYPSAVKCAQENGLLPTTLNERLRSNGCKVYSDGNRYSYYIKDK